MLTGPAGIVAYVGIGANLGDPLVQCREALDRMHRAEGIHLLRHSPFYRTEPWGDPAQPWFVNAVAEIRTDTTARDLLRTLRGIEDAMGRERDGRWGPRRMDLDLLLFGQAVIQEPDLVVPHPAMHRRGFVLVPLAEMAPYVLHPAFGVSVRGLLDRLEDRGAMMRLTNMGEQET